MPETYDRCLGPALFEPYADHLASMIATSEPLRVLELAAGSGITTAALVRHLPHGAIVATDLNPAMVGLGARQVPSPTWAVADAQDLGAEFTDHRFDLAVCQFGVMFFPDRPRAYSEVAAALAPTGRFLFSAWDRVEASPFPAALIQGLRTIFPTDPPTFVARVPHGYTDPQQIADDLISAGFDVDSIERTTLTGRSPSARVLAEGFCRGTPLRFELERRGDLDELTAAVGDEMTALLGDGQVDGALVAFVMSAHVRGAIK